MVVVPIAHLRDSGRGFGARAGESGHWCRGSRAVAIGQRPRGAATDRGAREHGRPRANPLRQRVRPRERRGVDGEQRCRGSRAPAASPGPNAPRAGHGKDSAAERPLAGLSGDGVADDERSCRDWCGGELSHPP
jgi:hypothetical protein